MVLAQFSGDIRLEETVQDNCSLVQDVIEAQLEALGEEWYNAPASERPGLMDRIVDLHMQIGGPVAAELRELRDYLYNGEEE